MSQILKIVLIVIGIGAIIFFGFRAITDKTGSGDAVLSSGTPETIGEVEEQANVLLARLSELKRYDVTGTLFSSAVFKSLVDYRIELVEEPTGRANPFAELP